MPACREVSRTCGDVLNDESEISTIGKSLTQNLNLARLGFKISRFQDFKISRSQPNNRGGVRVRIVVKGCQGLMGRATCTCKEYPDPVKVASVAEIGVVPAAPEIMLTIAPLSHKALVVASTTAGLAMATVRCSR